MKRLVFFVFAISLIFSCKNDSKVEQTKAIASTKETAKEIQKEPIKKDNPNLSKAVFHRIILENPDGKEVSIEVSPNNLKTTKDLTSVLVLEETETLKFTIDGKKHEEKLKGAVSVLINASRSDLVKEENLYIAGKRVEEGPFKTPITFIPKKSGKGMAQGHFELIKDQLIITGFELGPDDTASSTIRMDGNEPRSIYKLLRY